MGTVVVFDLESDCTFDTCVGSCRQDKFQHMQITVACAMVLDSSLCTMPGTRGVAFSTAKACHWWRDVAERGKDPFEELLLLFDDTDVIVGYNCLDFDFPLLRKHYGKGSGAHARYIGHRLKTIDPFSRIRATLGTWPKLDDLLKANGLEPKTGDGKGAIRLWEQGFREELLAYCASDVVALTKMTLLASLEVPGYGRVGNGTFGIASALAAARIARVQEEERGFWMHLLHQATKAAAWLWYHENSS